MVLVLVPMVFDGFVVRQPLVPMVFQWFPMVANHWSNDGLVTIHRYGLHGYNIQTFNEHFTNILQTKKSQIWLNLGQGQWFNLPLNPETES